MRLVERVKLPSVTSEQRTAYAILCAIHVQTSKKWREWAMHWLYGRYRMYDSDSQLWGGSFSERMAAAVAERAFEVGQRNPPDLLAISKQVMRSSWKSTGM
jgi:hypothetical protein